MMIKIVFPSAQACDWKLEKEVDQEEILNIIPYNSEEPRESYSLVNDSMGNRYKLVLVEELLIVHR